MLKKITAVFLAVLMVLPLAGISASAEETAKEKNIISVAAAGNEYTSDKSYPAAYEELRTVHYR